MKFFPAVITTLFLVGCNKFDTQISSPTLSQLPADIELRATSDLTAPAPIKQISFVPNNVASWLGHIIMVDEYGDLHRATTNSKVIPIQKGDYADVIGLDRPNKAGAFLAMNRNGTLRAFIEADNEGNFKSIPLSAPNTAIKSFCQANSAYENRLWARTDNGTPAAFDIEFIDESGATLTHVPEAESDEACTPLTIKAGGAALSVKQNSPFLHFGDKNAEMVNGLSIQGLATPSYATLTHVNMGSVFADGVLIAADSETGRLILIARSYLLDVLGEP